MFARIKFELQNQAVFESFIIDANIQNDTIGGHVYMGFYGRINNELYPFVFLADGRFDYGSYAEHEYRYYASNIRDHQIQIGEYITTWRFYNGGRQGIDGTYRITEIINLQG